MFNLFVRCFKLKWHKLDSSHVPGKERGIFTSCVFALPRPGYWSCAIGAMLSLQQQLAASLATEPEASVRARLAPSPLPGECLFLTRSCSSPRERQLPRVKTSPGWQDAPKRSSASVTKILHIIHYDSTPVHYSVVVEPFPNKFHADQYPLHFSSPRG